MARVYKHIIFFIFTTPKHMKKPKSPKSSEPPTLPRFPLKNHSASRGLGSSGGEGHESNTTTLRRRTPREGVTAAAVSGSTENAQPGLWGLEVFSV